MCQSTFLIVTIGLLVLVNFVDCLPLYGEIESDLDTTKQSIVRANKILSSINRDVDLCLSNSIACTLKSYDDLDYQTSFESNQQQSVGSLNSYSSSGDSIASTNVQPTTTTGYSETDEANVTLSPPTIDSTGQPPLSMYGRVPTIKIVVSPSSDQKFIHVLDDLDSLEVHVQSAITNFTSSRRYTYTAMLKPMLKHIHQLRNNLSLLHNRLIGVAALTNIASQVNELTDHISDALVGGSDVPLDDSPSSLVPSSSSTTTTSTTTTTTPAPSTTNNQNPTTINSQPNPAIVLVASNSSSTTIKPLPTVLPSSTTTLSPLPSSPSNPTTINDESIIETTTRALTDSPDDNVDEITITSTIKPIN